MTQSSDDRAVDLKKQQSLMKALKMSAVHVILFVVSWMPYTVMATWYHDLSDKPELVKTLQGHY